jgi:hypothetical protein
LTLYSNSYSPVSQPSLHVVADVLKFFKMLRQSYNKKSSRFFRIITSPFPKLSIASRVNVSQMVVLLTIDMEHWLPNTRRETEWQEGHPSTDPWTPNNTPCKCFQPFIGFWFFWFLKLKNRPEPNKTGLVWTGSRFGPGYFNKEYYFPVWLNFWVKIGPNRIVNTSNRSVFIVLSSC